MVSSSSAWYIRSSLSDEELPVSYSIMLILPTELDMAGLSVFAIVDQRELVTLIGESGAWDVFGVLLKRPFLGGIIIPRPPIIGEESGEDCSASVE